jgi:hypothetical protein
MRYQTYAAKMELWNKKSDEQQCKRVKKWSIIVIINERRKTLRKAQNKRKETTPPSELKHF